MPAPGVPPDLPPDDGASWLIDGDDARRPRWQTAVIATGALAVALLVVLAVRALYEPPPAEEVALQRAGFRPDDPGERGYVAPKLDGKLALVIPSGLGGSNVKGDVVLGVIVSPKGEVTSVAIVKSLDPVLDGIARRAAWKARFHPASRNGQPSEGKLLLTVPFEPF